MTNLRNQLTNECLTRSLSPFEVAELAIEKARQMIQGRKESKFDAEILNQAYRVLLEILEEMESPKEQEEQVDA